MNDPEQLPSAVATVRRRVFSIWLIPLVAALIAGWMVGNTLLTRGPLITITFKSAEGIEAGKTKVRFKDVDVGDVIALHITPDLSGVVAEVRMVREVARLLTDRTRFWVVRPRLEAGGVSGLGTLVSGSYIEMDPGRAGVRLRAFEALERPPIIRGDQGGRRFTLVADRLGSFSHGSPIHYRGFEVGKVIGYELREDWGGVLIHVFINAPFNDLVLETSRFWNASGIGVRADAGGLRIQAESLQSIIAGGIAFETPPEGVGGRIAADGAQFPLFADRESMAEASFTEKWRVVLYFDSSVRGVAVGAPVEFRGIRIGRVADVRLEVGGEAESIRIPVTIEIEPDRFLDARQDEPLDRQRRIIGQLVARGLRAQLMTGSLVTGQRFVDLDFRPNTPARLVGMAADLPEIPTLPSELEELTASVSEVVDKLRRLPLEEIGHSLMGAAKGVDRLVNADATRGLPASVNRTLEKLTAFAENLDRTLLPDLVATMKETRATLAEVKAAASDNSPLREQLGDVLTQVEAAARAVRDLAAYLERRPEALLTGKHEERDRY